MVQHACYTRLWTRAGDQQCRVNKATCGMTVAAAAHDAATHVAHRFDMYAMRRVRSAYLEHRVATFGLLRSHLRRPSRRAIGPHLVASHYKQVCELAGAACVRRRGGKLRAHMVGAPWCTLFRRAPRAGADFRPRAALHEAAGARRRSASEFEARCRGDAHLLLKHNSHESRRISPCAAFSARRRHLQQCPHPVPRRARRWAPRRGACSWCLVTGALSSAERCVSVLQETQTTLRARVLQRGGGA